MSLKHYWFLNDLEKFCREHELLQFTANEEKSPIVVSMPAQYAAKSLASDDDRFLSLHLKTCHTLTNRNRTDISHDVMLKNAPSLANCPILADMQKYTDENGEIYYDFAGHTMEPMEDPYTGEERMNYIERVVGVIPANSKIELKQEYNGKREYLHADGLIYEEHGNLAATILRNRKEVACSVEIAVKEMHYDLARNVLVIDDFEFVGVTLLGKDVRPGMEGAEANIELEDVSSDSVIAYSQERSVQLNELLSRIQTLEEQIAEYKISEKGGNGMKKKKFEADPVEETVDESVENVADTEETKVFEADAGAESDESEDAEDATDTAGSEQEGSDSNTESSGTTGDGSEEPSTPSEPAGGEDDEEQSGSDDEQETPRRAFEIDEKAGVIRTTFEIEASDLARSLYELVRAVVDTDCIWMTANYIDTHEVIFEEFDKNRFMRYRYEISGDSNISLVGEGAEVFPQYVTASEKAAITAMREQYAAAQAELSKYHAAEDRAEKQALMQNSEYALIAKSQKFSEIDIEKYTVDELRAKLDGMLLEAAKLKFSQKSAEDKPVKKSFVQMFSMNADTNTESTFLRDLAERASRRGA
nr:MAG TPA: hypothetical protein [Caudoviricetes sp.]